MNFVLQDFVDWYSQFFFGSGRFKAIYFQYFFITFEQDSLSEKYYIFYLNVVLSLHVVSSYEPNWSHDADNKDHTRVS